MEEIITIGAKKKKEIKELMPNLSDLGFNRVEYRKKELYVEKLGEADLKGKKNLDYSILFEVDKIVLTYGVPNEKLKGSRLMEVLPVFLNTLVIAEKFYDVKPSKIYPQVIDVIEKMRNNSDKDAVDLSAELEELKTRHKTLDKKYGELVRSSEENTRILLECERRRDELRKRVDDLESVSEELLVEEIYNWIKVHNGVMDIGNFSKTNNVPTGRIEEGLNKLIKEGYIKKRR